MIAFDVRLFEDSKEGKAGALRKNDIHDDTAVRLHMELTDIGYLKHSFRAYLSGLPLR